VKKTQRYDESAKVYHRRYLQIQLTKYQAIAPYLSERPVLDIGIGTGIGLHSLIDSCPVIGIDGSVEMLRFAAKHSKNNQLKHESIFLIVASAEALPFRDHVFPMVISITVLQNLTNIECGIKEIQRVLQAEGLLAVTVLAKIISLAELEAMFLPHFSLCSRFENLANEDNGLLLQLQN
jgi:ubiquinone/menaquinone biosynthesis C-methylase UbiE